MSIDIAKAFLQKAQGDRSLQDKLSSIAERSQSETIAAVVKLAGDAGFLFTANDYEAVIGEELGRQHAAGELSQRELKSLSAGIQIPGLIGIQRQGCVYQSRLTW